MAPHEGGTAALVCLPRRWHPAGTGGIWQEWGEERQPTFAIITTEANAAMAPIHDRMPLVIEQKDWGLWLGEQGRGAAVLMKPAGDDVLALHRVSTAVNSNRAQGPELIEPIDA